MTSTRAVVMIACTITGIARAAPGRDASKAAPHRVIVLPIDGTADPALRATLGATVKRLAHSLDGTVTDGDTTFAETAAAVGCDPATTACANQVLATLAVDEIVYATATTTNGSTRVVVRRISKDAAPIEATATLTAQDPPERLEPPLAPLFPGAVIAQPVLTPTPAPAPTPIEGTVDTTPDDHRDRNIGIACVTGGGVFLVIGLALWASESGIQTDIDHHSTSSPDDFRDLLDLEGRASTRAALGNVFFLTGLVAGGIGGYFLWRSFDAHVVVAPQPLDHGGGVSLAGRW